MLTAFSQACGRDLPYVVAPRRAGDLAAYWADATLAHQALGWTAQRGLDEMCADTWHWQSSHPTGYAP
jgi:UDP-glucose 4-epimerase